jgi:outer membrane lipoprotein-sorting protein
VYSGGHPEGVYYTSDMAPLRPRRELTSFFLVFLMFWQAGCLVRRRTVAPQGQKVPKPLLSASKEELIQRLHQIYDPIQSFTIKTDMSPSIGSLFGGQVTDYPTVTGYILFLRPDNIRVIGLDPVIHSTGFDMVSTGNEFRVSIPVKSQFIEGRNDAPAASNNKLENLRPTAFLHALLIRPPDPGDITFAEDDTNETRATYILMMIGHDSDHYFPLRNVYFDRYTLQINRQKTFDKNGEILSETRYSNWQVHNGIAFPATIDIQRPKDGYEVVLDIKDIKFNAGDITPAKFVLNQPPGSHLKQLE